MGKGILLYQEIDMYKKPYNKTQTQRSYSHYGVEFYYSELELIYIKVTKVVVKSSTRTLTGDGKTKYEITTDKGTKLSSTGSGTIDGIAYSVTTVQNPGQYTITFDKPIKIARIYGWCGSGVGQWREYDDLSINVVGLSK